MKRLHTKLLTSAREKVAAGRILALSGIEILVYFTYRVEQLLLFRKVLVKNEVAYLLTETGPGNLRFSPELTNILLTEKYFISPFEAISPEIQLLLNEKLEVEKYLLQQQSSQATQELFLRILHNYFERIELLSTSPIIFNAQFNNIPITCLIKNGGWVCPDSALFTFLQGCQAQKRFPIVIAKKISGILFPVFKALSVLGANLNKVYLPIGIIPLLETIESHSNVFSKIKSDIIPLLEKTESGLNIFTKIKYCNQFAILANDSAQDVPPQIQPNNTLKYFLERTLPSHLNEYNHNFMGSKIKIESGFSNTIANFKNIKLRNSLIKDYQTQQNFIQELRLNFPGDLPQL